MTALEEIAHLADIHIDIQAELDRITMTIEEILQMEPGTVIQTNRSAGENIELVIGGSMIGSGEIVIIDETVGVRITDFREGN
jgi:flagellar motor switch protein FliN/FliY